MPPFLLSFRLFPLRIVLGPVSSTMVDKITLVNVLMTAIFQTAEGSTKSLEVIGVVATLQYPRRTYNVHRDSILAYHDCSLAPH